IVRPLDDAERDLAEYHAKVQALNAVVPFDITRDPELLPLPVQQLMRDEAIALARRGHGFEEMYRRYYQGTFGPIVEELR
ncbi:MAG TPA: hypothetical protein VD926_06370, partial [Acidimicrobiales bacterium]|nr:hypothetical protein [Acidimicrobiales bacterium]